MNTPSESRPVRVRKVRTYLTDLAAYRDQVFGQDRARFSAGEFTDVAVRWIDRQLVEPHCPLDTRRGAEPWSIRASLVRADGADAPGKTHLIRAIELLALGASMHDAIGAGKPFAPVTDRELVLLGDLLFSRALIEINRGPSELQWIVQHTFRELVLNQFLASTKGLPDATSALHTATAGGGARLAAASVRCSALIDGYDEATADQLGRVASRLALSAQLAFDLQQSTRRIGGTDEVNHRNALWLALAENGDGQEMAGASSVAAHRRARAAVADRGLGWLEHVRAESRGLARSIAAPFHHAAACVEEVLLDYTPRLAHAGAASA